MIPIDLAGRLALVTGAGGQLGRTIVRTLAEAGADVVVHYLQGEAMASKLRDEIAAAERRSMIVRADVTNAEEVTDMGRRVRDSLGSPDIVVCNAVIQYQWKEVLDQDPADYESQFRSCVMQNVLMAKTFVPAMKEKGWGRLIAMNTECSMQYWKTQSAYISGKRGMDGVLRVLAREVGELGITVNQVAPGFTLSESVKDEEEFAWYREAVPLRRRGTDREVANVVAFLASDLASFITGAYIPVCGGNVMPAI